ncbi:MAG: hypothetical protein HY562_09225 [Ignavibacteriales bacterium]|nr:hypothetical protein [Ignavibacteriales bacterium]
MNTQFFRILLLSALVAHLLEAQKIFNGCGMQGNAKHAKLKALNELKNRYTFPASGDFDKNITLDAILEPGDDEARFSASKAAEVTGYVVAVKKGGIETCNCKAKSAEFRDAHIELVLNPSQKGKTRRFIVEVTPRIRKKKAEQGKDWSTSELKSSILHKWVKVQGWMFFDSEHWYNAHNTNEDGDNIWRATAWEIHPVTSIEIIQNP